LGNFSALDWRQLIGSCSAAFFSAQTSKLDRRGIPAVLLAVLDLTRRYVADELGELEWVSRSFLAGLAHIYYRMA
jgi:hypothetical protein